MSPAFECRTNLPIAPRTEHRFGRRDNDRRGDDRDRKAADHQRGLSTPNNSSLGMVIGPIGLPGAAKEESPAQAPSPLQNLPLPPRFGLQLGVLLAVPGLQVPQPHPRPGAPDASDDVPAHRRQVGGVAWRAALRGAPSRPSKTFEPEPLLGGNGPPPRRRSSRARSSRSLS